MWKNYMLAALNVAVAGLPFLVGWDLVLYGVYCGFAVLLLGLTAWNPVGDWLSILFVFYAKAVPEEALILPVRMELSYLHSLIKRSELDYLAEKVLLCRKPDSLLYPYQPEAGGSFPGSGRLLDPRL